MKKMFTYVIVKKTLSVFTACLLILSGICSVAAYSPLPPDTFESTKDFILSLFKQQYSDIVVKEFEVISVKDDYIAFRFTSDNAVEQDYFSRFDIYYEKTSYTMPVFSSGLVIASADGSRFYSLEDAHNIGICSVKDIILASMYDTRVGIVGANKLTERYSLSVQSVTEMQRTLTENEEDIDTRLYDFNSDNVFNVNDVSALQRYLCK